MSRYRRLILPLLLLAGLGCAPEGPTDFYRETLQARSEFADTMTFIVDEATATRFFPPAEKILKKRTDDIREAYDGWDKKTEVRGGFDRVAREQFRPSDIGAERKLDMAGALLAYQDFCEKLEYVNAQLGREAKRLEIVYETALAQKAEAGQAVGGGDLPNLKAALERVWNIRDWPPPRIFGRGMTKEYLTKFTEMVKIDVKTELVTEFDPGNIFAVNPKIKMPPPPARPAAIDNAVGKMAEKIAAIKDQLGKSDIVVSYGDEAPRQMSLRNETGKTLRNISGFLVAKFGETDRWVPISIPDLQKDPFPMPIMGVDNPTGMRLMFQAEIEGKGQVAYDQRLGAIPQPKRN